MTTLVLLQAGLHQLQVGGFEAVEATVSPFTGIRFLFVFVSALHDAGTDFGLVFALAQLFHCIVHIPAGFLIEQAHFLQDAADVALGFVVTGEFEFLVFVDQIVWDAQRCNALWAVRFDVFHGLDLIFGLGECLMGDFNERNFLLNLILEKCVEFDFGKKLLNLILEKLESL